MCFASVALAEDFKTINGKEYKDATVSRVEPDGIVLKSKSGITKVYFTELPKDVLEHFHYDSAQGAHSTANREATTAQKNAAFGEHRLGATADQFVGWYGVPQDSPGLDKNFPCCRERFITLMTIKAGESASHFSDWTALPFEWSTRK